MGHIKPFLMSGKSIRSDSLKEIRHFMKKFQKNKIPLGAHIYSSRISGLYYHHGIYCGNGKVIQYSGFSKGLCSGPVNKISLEEFLDGDKELYIRFYKKNLFSPKEIIRRAESRLGEDKYNVFSNNCEHFCTWVKTKQASGLEFNNLFNKILDVLVIVKPSLSIVKSVTSVYCHIKRKKLSVENDQSLSIGSSIKKIKSNENIWEKILKNIKNWQQASSAMIKTKTPAEFVMKGFVSSKLATKQVQRIKSKIMTY